MKHTSKALTVLAVALVFLACNLQEADAEKASLKLTKHDYQPGETITVKYKALDSFAANAWIGIIPSNIAHGNETVNDQHDISYKYMKKSTAGSMTFTAPSRPGSYDFRMHDTDSNGKEVAHVTFKVGGPSGNVALDYQIGDMIQVLWKGTWYDSEVIALQKGTNPYKIHYIGWSNSWDEWIGKNRMRRKK